MLTPEIIKSTMILLAATCLSSCANSTKKDAQPEMFFDDFSYTNLDEFYKNNWKVRSIKGHPGIEGADWSTDGVSFHRNIADTNEGILRMTSFTDGTGKGTRQTQFCHERKYLYGTYAARVFFRNAPTFGPDGDEVIQTFYAISPLDAPMDENYSEVDFEYLPNGGWGQGEASALWTTTWETFQLEPWTKVNEFTRKQGNYEGWHTLHMNVHQDKVSYYIDGEFIGEHSEKVAPEKRMSINFNLWFMPVDHTHPDNNVNSPDKRQYEEDIDWVFFIKDDFLSLADIQQHVRATREKNVAHIDSVYEGSPELESPCGL